MHQLYTVNQLLKDLNSGFEIVSAMSHFIQNGFRYMQSIHFVKLPPQHVFRLDDNLLPSVLTLIYLNSVTDFENFIVINMSFFNLICTTCRHVFLCSCMHNLEPLGGTQSPVIFHQLYCWPAQCAIHVGHQL